MEIRPLPMKWSARKNRGQERESRNYQSFLQAVFAYVLLKSTSNFPERLGSKTFNVVLLSMSTF